MDMDTNPEGSVADAPASIEDRMLSLLGAEDGQPERRDEDAEQVEAEAPEDGQAEVEDEGGDEVEAEAEESEDAEAEESDDEEADEGEDDQPQTRTFKVGDEEVTEDELIKGYQRQADYTRKTQEVAEQRKANEAERQKFAQERQAYAQRLEFLESQIPLPKAPDTSILDEDPVEYLRQKTAYEDAVGRLQAIQAERQRVEEQSQAEMQRARQELVKAEFERMAELVPEWSDPEKRSALGNDLANYMRKEGYPDQEIGNLTYARHLNTVRKAMLWDQLQGQKPAVEKKVRKAPKVVKPGAAQTRDSKAEDEQRAMRRLKQSGSLEDAASAILARMK